MLVSPSFFSSYNVYVWGCLWDYYFPYYMNVCFQRILRMGRFWSFFSAKQSTSNGKWRRRSELQFLLFLLIIWCPPFLRFSELVVLCFGWTVVSWIMLVPISASWVYNLCFLWQSNYLLLRLSLTKRERRS